MNLRTRLALVLSVLAAGWALLFLTIELITAHKEPFWAGWRGLDGGGILLGGTIYAVGIVITYATILLFAAAVRRTVMQGESVANRSQPRSASSSPTFLSALSAFAVWTCVSFTAAELSSRGSLLALALVLVWAGASEFMVRFGASPLSVAAMLLFTNGAGLLGVLAAGHVAFFSPHRDRIVEMSPIIWMTIAALILWALRRNFVGRIVGIAVVYAVPLALLVLSEYTSPNSHRTTEPPNLILITCDALRSDICSVYGGPVSTPAFERLAEDGVKFAESYSLAPWTLPSFQGLLTSNHPRGLTPGGTSEQWESEHYILPADTRTLAQVLHEQGYATGGFVGSALLRNKDNHLRGFDQTAYCPFVPEHRGILASCPRLREALASVFPRVRDIRPPDTSRFLTLHAQEFLRRNRNQPFFLWVHYFNPHDPYDPPDRFRTLNGPWPIFSPYFEGYGECEFDANGRVIVAEDDRDYVVSLYAGAIRYLDERVGEVLDSLEALNLDENTYICLTSDHGEELWEHEHWGHGFAMFQPHIRVPLLFWGPGLTTSVVGSPVSGLDVMPTLADAAGAQPVDAWRGISLLPVMKGGSIPERPVFVNATTHQVEPQEVVIWNGYKLVEWLETKRSVLYRLSGGIEEVRVEDEYGKAARNELSALLASWRASNASANSGEKSPLDSVEEDLAGTLRSMGYLD